MIRVTVLYPNRSGASFDIDYYRTTHAALVRDRLGSRGLIRFEVDRGVGGATPGATAPYAAMGHCYFDTLEDFQVAFGEHGPELIADVPNFTTIEPVVQISEVVA